MAGAALYQNYRYLYPSALVETDRTLRLATCTDRQTHPYFFQGQLQNAGRAAELLRGLMHIVQARYHVPAAMLEKIVALADPVVTCNDDRLRFEGFSGCCGVYARIDFLPAAIRGDAFGLGRGTTNVDFNPPMLFALTKLRDGDDVTLSVGTEGVAIESESDTVVEKRVKLPLRWLRGLVEVQACQSRMQLVHDISALEARRFLRSLPRMKTHRHPTWIVPSGRGLRITQAKSNRAVKVGGLQRLRVLESLSQQAKRLRIFTDNITGASAWELDWEDCRFHLVVSPEVWRGFSGEGQVLEATAAKTWQKNLPKVRAALQWDSVVDIDRLSRRLHLSTDQLNTALSVLATRGLVGYDLGESAYFHRELPFDLDLIEKLQPRLTSARELVGANAVQIGNRTEDHVEVYVQSGNVKHRVRLSQESAKCTCPWFSKHRDSRGPCKHILAAQIVTEDFDD